MKNKGLFTFLMILGGVILFAGFIKSCVDLSMESLPGFLIVGFIFFIIGWSIYNKEYNENKDKERAEEEENKRREESSYNYAKEYSERNIIKYDIRNSQFNIEFEKKYGISFFDLKKKIWNIDKVRLIDTNSEYHFAYNLVKFTVNYKNYIILSRNEDIFESVLYKELWTDNVIETYNKYFNMKFIENYIFPYDYFQYIEYISDTNTHTFNNSSTIGLAVHEELFGTVSALNKYNANNRSYTIDNSYLLFYFNERVGHTVLKHNLSDNEKNTSYFKGMLAELWQDKDINRVRNKALSQTINTSSDSDDDKPKKLSSTEKLEKLKELKELLESNVISQEDFESLKKEILNS